jgi:uncharacterized tellurite resistance protein B-like protein
MLDGIRSFFNRNLEMPEQQDEAPEAAPAYDPIQVAACALLLELAYADDEFTEDERAHIEVALGRHFDIDSDMVNQLMQLADEERRKSVDLYQFTRLIAERYDLGQKMVLAEVMWGVVYADGELAKHESYLMRKVSNLLGLKPGYLAEARKKATGEGV